MSHYIQDPKNIKCKIPVFSALTTGGTGQDRIHFSFIRNGAGQNSVPPRFRQTFMFRGHRGGPFRHASATLSPNLEFYHVPCTPRWAVPPRFRHAFANPSCSVSTEEGRFATLPQKLKFRSVPSSLEGIVRRNLFSASVTLPPNLKFCSVPFRHISLIQ